MITKGFVLARALFVDIFGFFGRYFLQNILTSCNSLHNWPVFKGDNVEINYTFHYIVDVFKFGLEGSGKVIVKYRFLNFSFFMA